MRLDRPLLTALRGSLALAGMALLGAGSLVWHAHAHLQSAQAAADTARAEHAETAARQASADAVAANDRRLTEKFAELQAAGLVGEERRAEWLRLLSEVASARRLPAPDCELSPARIDGDGALRTTHMRLRMPLLHEGDLLTLLDQLHARAPALIRMRACRLERLPAGEAMAAATLRADCQFDWHTFAAPAEAR